MIRRLQTHDNSLATHAFTELAFAHREPDRSLIETQNPLQKSENGINYYGQQLEPLAPFKPLKILVLTSLRDIAVEERIGQTFRLGNQEVYRKGTLEALLESCKHGALEGIADVAAVVTDDYTSDLKGLDIPLAPIKGKPWVVPPTLTNAAGDPLTDIAVNIGSAFRKLPLSDTANRSKSKYAFEAQIVELAERSNADIILSDHYLARLEYLIKREEFGMQGRVINIHPGITHAEHPMPCPGNIPDEIALHHAQGKRWDPALRAWTGTHAPYTKAGASLHFVAESIDTGSVICDAELSRIHPSDSLELVQYKIYRDSKIPVLLSGLAHYAENFYPHIVADQVNSISEDFSSFSFSIDMLKIRSHSDDSRLPKPASSIL